jgi:hypothetical protein
MLRTSARHIGQGGDRGHVCGGRPALRRGERSLQGGHVIPLQLGDQVVRAVAADHPDVAAEG